MPVLSISVLGPLHVALDDAPVSGFEYTKVRALLAYLAVEAGTAHPRAELCALLWPDLPEKTARRNLTQALSALRHALHETDDRPPLLLATSETVEINGEVRSDVIRFSTLLDQSERHAHRSWHTCSECAERLHEALALYRGDFLSQLSVPDSIPFEEWALLWRERLRQRTLSALERLAQRAEWCGDYRTAADHARRMAELDSLREASHRELIRLLALDEQWSAAEAHYEQVRRSLRSELGVEPESETVELREHIRTRAHGELRHFEPPPFQCPEPPNILIGRAVELEAICTQLRALSARALTLTGTPGLGKTRLAIAAAHALRYDFEDGVYFVELAPLAGAAGVPSAIAQQLNVKEQSGHSLAETLTARLKPQRLLLVLDNFEHVLEAAAFIADLLAACPAVKVLATSRAPLLIRAERQHSVAPLAAAASVQLFLERVQAQPATISLTEAQRASIAELCARLDHLPLAIELFAVRARSLAPAELLQQLEPRLTALVAGPRDLPERQRTLRGAIAWSYDLLSAEEQRVFALLGVFAGGCTLEAAQAVVGESQLVLPALEALARASLVQTHVVAGETRFTLLETIREYALEQLAAHEAVSDGQRRHAEYFTALAERAGPELRGPRMMAWLARMSSEHENLRAALAWAAGATDESLLRLAGALDDYWETRGFLTEGRRWLALALKHHPNAARPLRASGLDAAAHLAMRQGDYLEARALFEQALALFQWLEDGPAIARVVRRLGNVAANLGDFVSATAHYKHSLDIARQTGNLQGVSAALNNLGLRADDQGDYEMARSLYQESLPIAREIGDLITVGYTLLNLGLVSEHLTELATARALLEESLSIFREIGYKGGIALVLLNLGNHLERQGDLTTAEKFFQESLVLNRELGDVATASYPLSGLAHIAMQRGSYASARRLLYESLRLRQQTGEVQPIARTLNDLGKLDRIEGEPQRAARLFGAAETLRERLGIPVLPAFLPEYGQEVGALRAALGEAAFEAEWAAGRALILEQAVALALEQVAEIQTAGR